MQKNLSSSIRFLSYILTSLSLVACGDLAQNGSDNSESIETWQGSLQCGGSSSCSSLSKSDAISASQPFLLQALHSEKCLAPSGSNLVQVTCDAGAAAQKWKFVPNSGQYWIQNQNGQCIFLTWGTDMLKDGQNIGLGECNNWLTRRFDITGNSAFTFTNAKSGKCIDVSGVSQENGANIHQWACHGRANQQFSALSAGDGVTTPGAKLVSYDWPTSTGQAKLSDRYRVRISSGSESRELEVLMSDSKDESGGGPPVFFNRSLSYANFASDFSAPVQVEIEKIFGSGTSDIEVFPSGYGIKHTVANGGKLVRFTLKDPRYLSVNFKSADNKKTSDGVVTHRLMVFADPLEKNVPASSGNGVIRFNSATTQAQINTASTVYFPKGFHQLRGQLANGILHMHAGQTVYIEGGAFISGKIEGTGGNMKVLGRGVITGRDWKWNPGEISGLIEIDGANNVVEGIVACDNNQHGVVPGHSATISRVKAWGWHYNNDGFRSWGGTVDNSFLAPTDDAFYVGGSFIEVSDSIIWQGFNGAVVTCGWGSYSSSGFVMRDSHIIYPEWNALGNNNGIIASQMGYDAVCDDVLFENVQVDGNIIALTNLKTGSQYTSNTFSGTVGGIHHVTFRNFKVSGKQVQYNWERTQQSSSKSLIRGRSLNNGSKKFQVHDVLFDNVSIGGTRLTQQNSAQYFDIDSATTYAIQFK